MENYLFLIEIFLSLKYPLIFERVWVRGNNKVGQAMPDTKERKQDYGICNKQISGRRRLYVL